MQSHTRVILIRHAEKPVESSLGVDANGTQDPRSLSVRGWQRAGALVRRFALVASGDPQALNEPPGRLIAAASTARHPSTRPRDTLAPLAEAVGIPIEEWHEGATALVAELLAKPGTTLVSWRHHGLPALAQALIARTGVVPGVWPETRFDLAWIIDIDGPHRRFTQRPQMLLAGDSDKPVARKAGSTPTATPAAASAMNDHRTPEARP